MSIDWIGRSRLLKPTVRNFVNGRWLETGGDPLDKHSPRDGELLCRFGGGQAKEVNDAVAIARRAFEDGRWARLPTQRRKDSLHKLARMIEAEREELALLECLDVGKPINDALSFDIPTAAEIIRFNAEAVDKLYGKVYGVDQSGLAYQLRRPLGVVAGIVGWNFPLVLAAGKIGPALAAGNSLVLKPSELTSFTTARLAELAIDAGIPEGVFNVIHGGPVIGSELAHHLSVDLLTFTGSSQTGKRLLIASGESNMKRLILECGGKAPNIVFDDCPNLDAVADAIVKRAFWNQGEVCSASSRLLVQENIKEELLGVVLQKVRTLRPADPLDPTTTFGALVSLKHKQKVLSYIESGQQDGAKLIYQSSFSSPFEGGYYVPPTIFDNVSSTQKIAQEEIFGPVLSVISFRDEADAITIANSTVYGLTAIVWTTDLGRAHRMAHAIRAGLTVVNATVTPASGIGVAVVSVGGQRESGIGTEGGVEGLMEYASTTAVQLFV